MSFQLPSTQEKAAFVHDQFERIARRYDLLNDLMSLCMHRQWKNAAVAELVGPQLSGGDVVHHRRAGRHESVL